MSRHSKSRTGKPIQFTTTNLYRLWNELGKAIHKIRGLQLNINVLSGENNRLKQVVCNLEEDLESYRERVRKQDVLLDVADVRVSSMHQCFMDRTESMRNRLENLVHVSAELDRQKIVVDKLNWEKSNWERIQVERKASVYAMEKTITSQVFLMEQQCRRAEETASAQERTIAAQTFLIKQLREQAEGSAATAHVKTIAVQSKLIDRLAPAAARTEALEEIMRELFELSKQLFISMSDPIQMELPGVDVHMLPCNCSSMYNGATVRALWEANPAREPVLAVEERRHYIRPIPPTGSLLCPARCPVCNVTFTSHQYTKRLPNLTSACSVIHKMGFYITSAMLGVEDR